MDSAKFDLIGLYSPSTWIIGLCIFVALVVLRSIKPVNRLWPNVVGTLLALGAVKIFILINFTETYRDVGTPIGVVFLAIVSIIAFTTPSSKSDG